MKKSTSLSLACTALLGLAALPDTAPAQMNYQGRLTDNAGNPRADGPYTMSFRLFTAISGGSAVWGPFVADGAATTGRGPRVDLVSGRFNTVLGLLDTTSRNLSTVLTANPSVFLEIEVEGTVIAPRQEILAAPRALHAESAGTALIANTVVDGAITTAKLAPNAVTTATIADGSITAAKLSSASSDWSTNAAGTGRSNGAVGMGNALPLNPASPNNANPGARLHVTNLQYGIAPTALFQSENCGQPCAQPAWTETIRLWNSNSNGRTGIGFMSRANGAYTQVPDVYVGTGDTAGSGSKDFRIATNAGGTLTDRLYLNGATGTTTVRTATDNYGLEQTDGNIRLATFVGAGNKAFLGTRSNHPLSFYTNSGAAVMTVTTNGRVGIGTETANRGILEISGSVIGPNPANRFYNVSTNNGFDNAGVHRPTSLYATGDVLCNELRAFSDQRTKKEIRSTDNLADLHTLQAVEIKDYQYIDTVTKGNTPQKKVIAQQLEKIYPQAVAQSTDVVPDIFKKAEIKDGWVLLSTDLKPAERVRLVGEKAEIITEVLEVRADAFRPANPPEGETTFVYGREVQDFRTVDYDAIAMLNVSATQELARQVKEKDEKIAALEKRIEALSAMEPRLAALEKSMATMASTGDRGTAPRKETAKR